MEQNNKIKVYTSSLSGNLEISVSGMKQTIEATNNRAKFFSEQSLKYRDEAKKYAEDARYYAEQNSDVSLDDLLNLKSELQKEINKKQDVGNYALKEELPINVSELLNDAKYTNEIQLLKAVPVQDNNAGKVLYTNGEETSWVGINAFQLFDTKLSDRALTYEESKGWALQGTYVYKEALAGSRYGYPDFYAKCLEEYNEATSIETVNGVEVKVHSNGHKFYDIANKDAIDSFFNTMGSAWFYGVDAENERVFLPRNNNSFGLAVDTIDLNTFGKGTRKLVAKYVSGTSWWNWYSDGWLEQGGQIGVNKSQDTSTVTYLKTFANNNYTLTWGVRGDLARVGEENWKCTSRSATSCTFMNNSAVYATYNWQACGYGAVPAPADYNLTEKDDVIKQLLYICVGNTTNYEGVTEVVNQGMDILEQVAQKVNVDGTNLTVEGKSLISSYAMPSSNYIDLTAGASGTTYTAPANGYFEVTAKATSTSVSYINISLDNGLTTQLWMPPNVQGNSVSGFTPCKKGQTFTLNYYNCSISQFIFIYAEGEV